jgi:short-subunit dehydrogenase
VQRRRDKLDALQAELEAKQAQLRARLLDLEHVGR